MNDLSILIYAADVLPKIATSLGALSFFTAIGIMAATVGKIAYKAENADSYTQRVKPETYEAAVKIKPFSLVKWLWVPVVLMLFAAMIPSKQTIYLIAGSEVGEMAINTPEAREVMGDIKTILSDMAGKALEGE